MKRRLKTAGALAIALLAAAATGRSAVAQSLAPGRLLVATPEIDDDSFAKSVVLVLHHDDNGTLGVVVNRPTWVKPHDVDPDFGNLEGYKGDVFRGGPVAVTQMIFLVRDPPAGAIEAQPIFDNVYAGGDPEQLPKLINDAPDTKRLRLYAGHAEWASGQLEREIAAGQWVVVDGSSDRVFAPDPTSLWDMIFHKGSEVTVDAAPVVPGSSRVAAASGPLRPLSLDGSARRIARARLAEAEKGSDPFFESLGRLSLSRQGRPLAAASPGPR